eukprot:2859090-Pyramimonas_sp.AAC.1
MMLALREPRACLFPFSEQEGTRGYPGGRPGNMQTWQLNRHRIRCKGPSFPDAVWSDTGYFQSRLPEPASEILDALRYVGVLILTSHHHDGSKQGGCPATRDECKRTDFHIKGILL